MLVTLARRPNSLPAHILELIVASSTPKFSRRFHNTHPAGRPLGTVPEVPSPPDLLSKLQVVIGSLDKVKLPEDRVETHNHLLDSLRVALGSRNIFRIRNAYQHLVRHSSAAAIMARDFEELSRMLDKHFSKCSNLQDMRMRSGTLEMAVEAAARGHIAGLRACLLLHLRQNDIPGVLSTYDKYRLARDAIAQRSDQPASAPPAEDKEDLTDPGLQQSDNGAADLILVSLAAYATQHRFDDAFDLFLALPISVHFRAAKVEAFCRTYLHYDHPLSRRVQKWARKLVLLRLISREYTLNNYISKLGNNKQIVLLERIYNSVISECHDIEGRIVIKPESLNKEEGGGAGRKAVIFPEDAWSTFIQAFIKCHRAEHAETLWNDVCALGLIPNRRMWTALLDGYGRHGHCEKAMVIWNRMLQEGVEPDEVSYGSMVSAYFVARRPNEGFTLFEQFRRQHKETADGRRSLSSPAMLPLYNIVLHGLCTNAMDERARSVLKEMVEQGPKPDIVSYNTFLRHYGRIGDMKGLAAVLRGLKPAGIQPDVHSFTTVLSALYKAGKPDAHTKTLEVMRTMGVQPNVATYSAIIDVIVRHGGEENFRKAVGLLEEMENSPSENCRPNEVTYTSLLAGLHRDGSISAQNARMYTTDLLERMRKHGALPNRTTYHILIKACLENPEPEGLETALGYYHEMEKRRIKLLNDTWYVMLAGLLRRGDVALAGEVLRDMFRHEHEPEGALVTLVDRVQSEARLANAL